MSFLNILQHPDLNLRRVAKPVGSITSKTKDVVRNMFDTMYKNGGIGLAATQVNVHRRIVVINVSHDINDELVLINPVIIGSYGKICMKERCLSITNKSGFVMRSKFVKITTMDIFGKKFTFQAKDLLSICIQHEIDHLNGILFIDYLKNKNCGNS
ncbi:peptide deformylase [Candidatus Riesia pediculischaeffi]|uniref:Peptide deformylase n=2 Tax=Candidatus Riesia pediculischaeffi TaxID=428411 RepID=A0A1V0HK87_9ENTR|nr:peptide deformylase [Candidatus Riesia pediculischaeffi]ARC53233.1 hypothetical protein AOQ87_00785 [Candidatus Riesia pediculischaeffi]KIE64119.1 Peptide deformylase [Candidatus Riesia pediculischaeffi PTSU]